ncbi:response regulator transcription factor [Paenibacillus sp. CAU 1782]
MYTVIIVDDELFVRKGLRGLIDWSGNGYVVIDEADNGDDALDLIRDCKPDLVITDIRMPGMDGIELIQAASELAPDVEFVIISGYNDFRYAQQAMRFGVTDYVLKPIDQEDIAQALAKLRDKLAEKKKRREASRLESGEKQIEALIRGELKEDGLSEWAKPWLEAGASVYNYALVELNVAPPWSRGELQSKNELREKIREAVRAEAPAFGAPVLYEHRKSYGFVVPDVYEKGGDENLRRFLQGVLQRIEAGTGVEVCIYAGHSVQSLEQLQASYASAKETVAYKFLKPGEPVLLHADIAGTPLYYKHLSQEAQRGLTDAMERNDGEAIRQAIVIIIAEFQRERFSPEAIKTAIVQCVLETGRLIRELQGDEKGLRHMEVIISWHDHNITLNQLRTMLEDFSFEAAEMIGGLTRTSALGVISKVKQYMDDHFHENINLKSISAQFYMNAAYLGQLFKKTYDVYFNDYLLQLRIEEAKRLLRQSDLRVYEIASRVGFNKPDYFVTQFEKLENMPPTEYRNRWK